MRLRNNNIEDLIQFCSKYNNIINYDICNYFCSGKDPFEPCAQVYGVYEENKLVAIMCATYSIYFPHADGYRACQISGARVLEDCRHKGYATELIKEIEFDAKKYFHADYLCCDSVADELYIKNGFVESDETRLWKKLNYTKEDKYHENVVTIL